MTRQLILSSLAVALLTTLLGCDDRASRIAEAAAERQAAQNLEMARVNQGVLKTTEQLQAERAQLNQGRDALEGERQTIARSRRTESALAVLADAGGVTAVALFALAVAWTLLAALIRTDEATEVVCELLLDELNDDAPPSPARRLEFDVAAHPLLASSPGSDAPPPEPESP